MGRSITPRYVVVTTENFNRKHSQCWKGRATVARLEAWVKSYEDSINKPDGCNAHIARSQGYETHVSRAEIRENRVGGAVVAIFQAPMFVVK